MGGGGGTGCLRLGKTKKHRTPTAIHVAHLLAHLIIAPIATSISSLLSSLLLLLLSLSCHRLLGCLHSAQHAPQQPWLLVRWLLGLRMERCPPGRRGYSFEIQSCRYKVQIGDEVIETNHNR